MIIPFNVFTFQDRMIIPFNVFSETSPTLFIYVNCKQSVIVTNGAYTKCNYDRILVRSNF